MKGRVLQFPDNPAALLHLEGYTLIAWRWGFESAGGCGLTDWLHGLWRPADGKGWYQSGWRVPKSESRSAPDGSWPAHVSEGRVSRAAAREIWRGRFQEGHQWHYTMSEEEAFPEKRRASA